jgi:hypothetical protein
VPSLGETVDPAVRVLLTVCVCVCVGRCLKETARHFCHTAVVAVPAQFAFTPSSSLNNAPCTGPCVAVAQCQCASSHAVVCIMEEQGFFGLFLRP